MPLRSLRIAPPQWAQAGLYVGLLALLAALGCSGKAPPPRVDCEPGFMERPQTRPVSTMPGIRDAGEALGIVEREYRRAGITMQGAETRLWVAIDASGTVLEALLSHSSGAPAADTAALRAMKSLQFTPASRNGVSVCLWLELPVISP